MIKRALSAGGLTGTERRTLALGISAVLLIVVGLAAVLPLRTLLAQRQNELTLAQANLRLAETAAAGAADLADRITETEARLRPFSLGTGAHQAALLQTLAVLQAATATAVTAVDFGSEAAGQADGLVPAQLPVSIEFGGTSAACTDMIERLEQLPDLVVVSVILTDRTTATCVVRGHLLQPSK